MDSNGRDARVQPINSDLGPQKDAIAGVLDKENDSESESLLLPRNGGIARGPPKVRRKVQWNDAHGNKLAEILEFQPR